MTAEPWDVILDIPIEPDTDVTCGDACPGDCEGSH